MKERLMQFVMYKTNGKKAKFGEMLGWSPQYTSRILNDGSIGMNVVETLVNTFPELNARWLITGTGSMIDATPSINNIMKRTLELLQLEKYIPVMTPEEIKKLSVMDFSFSADDYARWEEELEERERKLDEVFEKAYKKS